MNTDQTSSGGYDFVDTGEWAIFKCPPLNWSWQYSGRKFDFSKSYDVRQEGIISSDGNIVYLGPYSEKRFRAGGQLFRLAIPEPASLQASISDVRSSLSFAARNLDVGGKNDEVVVVAAPSSVDWGWGGLQSGANGFWAVDTSRVDNANNTWVHEYVHTRQEWQRHESTDWLVEGTTNYYAALLTLRQGHISFSRFHQYLMTDHDRGSVLVDKSQWTSPNAFYSKGRRVLAALDAEIRVETDGNYSFEDVFEAINATEGSFTHGDLRQTIRQAVGLNLDDWLAKYVESSAVPVVPDDESLFVDEAPPTPPEPESEEPETEEPESDPEEPESVEPEVEEPESDPEEPESEELEVEEPESDPEEPESVEPEVEEPESEPEDQTDECPVCESPVGTDDEFCTTCGTALDRQCPVCGRDVTDEPYCRECGTEIQETCGLCGHRVHSSDRYCPNCGTDLS
ncbi:MULTISPECIES: zinc ribbon domain-containing protein [Haloferax]|uniref:double zinc ribbon domain-containing protein n=1 Tax=Haloferax TaxID=2251 RepID=UPI001786F50C|nr:MULTISPECIES: zinc ribbon domain-containing protein [Haloferax]